MLNDALLLIQHLLSLLVLLFILLSSLFFFRLLRVFFYAFAFTHVFVGQIGDYVFKCFKTCDEYLNGQFGFKWAKMRARVLRCRFYGFKFECVKIQNKFVSINLLLLYIHSFIFLLLIFHKYLEKKSPKSRIWREKKNQTEPSPKALPTVFFFVLSENK